MGIDAVAGPPRDLVGDGLHTEVLDLGRPSAARADHVMVMERLAGDVGVLAARKVDALERVELGIQLESPEDRGSPYAQPLRARVAQQIGCREMALAVRDQLGHSAARGGDPVARTGQGGHEWLQGFGVLVLADHRQMILSLDYAVNDVLQWAPVRPNNCGF